MQLFRRTLAMVLSLLLFIAPFSQAQAAIINNGQIIQKVQQTDARDTLLQTIQRKDVQQRLLDMGVTTGEIESRINQMTPDEVAQLNQQIDQLPAGGDGLGILVLVFLVFVITDVIGATDIFPFIHPVR